MKKITNSPMSRTHAAMAPGQYDDTRDTALAALSQSMEQELFIQEVIREKGLRVSVETYMAFVAFLKQPDIDKEIENDAEHPHHNSPGSASAYHDATLKVATEKFQSSGTSINDLLVIRDAVYAYRNSAEIKQRVTDIISSDLMESAGVGVRPAEPIAVVVQEMADEDVTPLAVAEENIPDAVAEVLVELEGEHMAELEPEDVSAYNRADMMGRLGFWQDRIFRGDHLYNRLKSVRAEAKHKA